MGPVTVIGSGGHAKVAIATLRACGHRVVAVFDDDPALIGTSMLGVEVAGPIEAFFRSPSTAALIAIGNNRTRRAIASAHRGVEWISAVHPGAIVHESVEVGAGALVCAGAVIQPETRIADHTIINTSSSVDHDCRIDAYAHIAPGAHLAGDVRVGEGTLIGIGSCVTPGVRVGDWAVLGAGAVATADIPEQATCVGVPARPIQEAVR